MKNPAMSRVRLSLALCSMLASPLAGAAEAYRVVVNPSNPTSSVERADLARLFMKKVAAWPDGTPVAVVDQDRTAPVRAAFSKDVHKKDADAVAAHWATQVYSGREVPPAIKRSDEDVLEFVRRTPGAVGYVSSAAPLQGVKAVSIK
jgi:ABC-type phosphate transport system substrate-binding protein